MLRSGIYKGWVRHRRFEPKKHEFSYPFAMICVDETNNDAVFDHPFWSKERWNFLSFCRKDLIHPTNCSISEAVASYIHSQTGKNFQGKVKVMSLFRSLGFYFNSVSFYLCYEGEKLAFILSEINNTPWDERHTYVHDVSLSPQQKDCYQFSFDKDFHVSPFMPMNLAYDWRFDIKPDRIVVHMILNNEQSEKQFDSTMHLSHSAFSTRNQTWFPWVYPMQGIMMLSRIYVQAFKLWLKRIPFYSHPKHMEEVSHEKRNRKST